MSTEEDDLLTREAAAELAEHAKRGKSRTKALGSLAWQRRNVSTLDKRYLTNTIIGAVQSNKRKETKTTRELSASNKRKETKLYENLLHSLVASLLQDLLEYLVMLLKLLLVVNHVTKKKLNMKTL